MASSSTFSKKSISVFNVKKHIIVLDGDNVAVFSAADNWKLTCHFSVFDFVKQPSAATVVVTESNEAVNSQETATPSKKMKVDGTRKKKEQLYLLCVGDLHGSLTFVSILTRSIYNFGIKFSSKSVPIRSMDFSNGVLFTGCQNGLVGSMHMKEKNLKCDWKCHDTSVNCVKISSCGSYLLTCAQIDLVLWNVETREKLKSTKPFSSSPTDLFLLLQNNVQSTHEEPVTTKEPGQTREPLVLSASNKSDYFVAWDVAQGTSTNFQLTGTSRQINCSTETVLQYPVFISSCNRDGSSQLFALSVNGKIAKSAFNIHVIDPVIGTPIPIVACAFNGSSLVIFYGAFPNSVVVEEVPLKSFSHEKELVLARKDPRKFTAKSVQSQISNVKTVTKNAKKVAVTKESCILTGDQRPNTEEPCLIDLLQKMNPTARSMEKSSKRLKMGSKIAKTAGYSTATILIQSLSSNDLGKVADILAREDLAVIRETVSNLKGPQAFLVFSHLLKGLDRTDRPSNYLWLRELCISHFHYLQACKSIAQQFSRIRDICSRETSAVERCKDLNSKLELLLLQSGLAGPSTTLTPTVPVFVDEDFNSGESDLDEMTTSVSSHHSDVKRKIGRREVKEINDDVNSSCDSDLDSDQSVMI